MRKPYPKIPFCWFLTVDSLGLSELDTVLGEEYSLPLSFQLLDDGSLANSPMAEQNGQYHAKKSLHKLALQQFEYHFDENYEQTEPYCWRHKVPLVMRPSRQVYLDLKKAKEVAKSYVETMTFVPETGKNRLLSHMEGREHWCVSRQRGWGVPLALLLDKNGNFHPDTPKFMDKAKELLSVGGVEHWHANKHSFVPSDAQLVDDVLDVWFDSGVLPQFLGRQGMALEGSDQHRGWFQSCLWVSAMLESGAPFSLVATHGFVVDQSGEKYSKSKGVQKEKTVDWRDVSSDVVRLWAMGGSFYQDRQWTKAALDQATSRYSKLRNTLRFLLANQTENHQENSERALFDHDAYWVFETEHDLNLAGDMLRECEFHEALSLVCERAELLSSVYFQALKDRLYCAKENSAERWSAEGAVHALLTKWMGVMELFCPRTHDEALPFVLCNHDLSAFQRKTYKDNEHASKNEMARVFDLKNKTSALLETLGLGSRGLVALQAPRFSLENRVLADYLDVGEVVYVEHNQLVAEKSTKDQCPRCRRPGVLNENLFCQCCEKRQKD